MISILLFYTVSQFALASDKSVEVVIQDGRFQPSLIELKSTDNITLNLTNKGLDAEEFESTQLNKEKMILPGKTVKIKIGTLRPGEYKFFGEFHPTTAQGLLKITD